MEFDWKAAIEKNRDELYGIVMVLLRAGAIAMLPPYPVTLPRALHAQLMSILRRAEFAARRLIAIAACKYDLKVPPLPEQAKAPAAGPNPPAPRDAVKDTINGAINPDFIPPFRLFDPLKTFPRPWLTADEIAHLYDYRPPVFSPALPADEPVPARDLCLRVHSLRLALQEIDAEAMRLARWRARRHLDTTRPRRWSPMRPGRPPGWKKKPKADVEVTLKEVHILAREAWDTS